MEDWQKEVIRDKYPYLCSTVKWDVLLIAELQQMKCLTPLGIEEVGAKATNYDQINHLLMAIQKRKVFDKFLDALRNSDQEDVVAELKTSSYFKTYPSPSLNEADENVLTGSRKQVHQASTKKLSGNLGAKVPFGPSPVASVNRQKDLETSPSLMGTLTRSLRKKMSHARDLNNMEATDKQSANLETKDQSNQSDNPNPHEGAPEPSGVMNDFKVKTMDQISISTIKNENRGNMYREVLNCPRGIALIISNNNFGQSEGTCTEVDCKNMANLLKQLGYMVIVKHNATAEEILRYMTNLARQEEDLDKSDSCVVVILSHGGENHILGVDKRPVHINSIWKTLKPENCRALHGKPKLFFIQAFRATINDKTVSTDDVTDSSIQPVEKLPANSDIVLVCSTSPGSISARHHVTGSWLVQSICKVFAADAYHTDILDLLTQVNNIVSKESGIGAQEKVVSTQKQSVTKCHKQISWPHPAISCTNFLNSLRFKFYLFPLSDRLVEEHFSDLETISQNLDKVEKVKNRLRLSCVPVGKSWVPLRRFAPVRCSGRRRSVTN